MTNDNPDWLFFTKLDNTKETPKPPNYRKFERTCPNGHIFYAPNLTKPCNTCSARESFLVEQIREATEDLFEVPFSRVSPTWAINPDTQRRITFKLYSPILNLVIDCQTNARQKIIRHDVCQKNNTFYLYVTNANLSSQIKNYIDEIKLHLYHQHDELKISRIISKLIHLEKPPFGYLMPTSEPLDYVPPYVQDDLEQTLNAQTAF